MDVIDYQLEDAEQFWDGKCFSSERLMTSTDPLELTDLASGDYHSAPSIEKALSAYIRFASMFLGMSYEFAIMSR